MIGKVLKLVFKKIEDDKKAYNKSAKAKFLSDKFEDENEIFNTPRTYLRYYDKYVLKISEEGGKPKPNLMDAFCVYLGFNDYADFIQQNNPDISNEKQNTKDNNKEEKSLLIESDTKKQTAPKRILIISILGIIALLLYIFSTFTNFFKKDNSTNPITYNIENFNANKSYYYYYDKNNKITLLDNDAILHFEEKNSKPITRKVLKTYFYQQGKDTSSSKYKTLQAQYFNKGNTPIIDTNKNKLDSGNTIKKTNITLQKINPIVSRKKINSSTKTKKSLFIKIQNKSITDHELLFIIQQKYQNKYQISTQNKQEKQYVCEGKSAYQFRKSKKNENRIICDLTLTYQVSNSDTKEIIESLNKKVIGTGFSEQVAKESAINKMALLLK